MTFRPALRGRPARGFALLVVLWTMVLLALIVTHLTATGRSEARIAQNLAGEARAEAAADGALYEAVFRVLDAGENRWTVDGSERHLRLDEGEVLIRMVSENGKINPNIAAPELMQALMQVVGVDSGTGAHLSAAIADWRDSGDQARPNGAKADEYRAAGLDYGPPGEPFQSLDELSQVLGMTPQILAAIRPHLSIYAQNQPDPNQADAIVRQALKLVPLPPDSDSDQQLGLDAIDLTVDARLKSGARFIRHAIVRLGAAYPAGYSVVLWEQGVPTS